MAVACALLVMVTLVSFFGNADSQPNDWSSMCPSVCKCRWVSGKKTAECANRNLTTLPKNLSAEVQSLDLSENNFSILDSEAFKSVGLVNLHKVHLKQCGIKSLHQDAFKGLQILIEIDLSHNRIKKLHPMTFRDNIRLRVLSMSHNPIERLEEGLFTNLTFLQTVEMKNCRINHISSFTFNNAFHLLHLHLEGNRLFHLKVNVFDQLVKLRNLDLHENPWRCDCHLKPFVEWVFERNLYTQKILCVEPSNLFNKAWNDIPLEQFACKPFILWPSQGLVVNSDGGDVTLSCKVTGKPMPEVYWVGLNDRIISNNTRKVSAGSRFAIKSSEDAHKWVNLTVSKVRPSDAGRYMCVARSPGGVDERNFSLVVSADGLGYGSSSYYIPWPMIIGLTIGLIALLVILAVLCCCFCRKRERVQGKKSPRSGMSPNGDVNHHIASAAEQEKCLLAVNPIQKPPRSYETPLNSNNGGTEVSETSLKLLEENANIASVSVGEEDHSAESIDNAAQRPREKVDSDAFPDLIAFPGRGTSTSPVGSSASAALDSRAPSSLGPQSPLHSPLYHHSFGTLPYSRSQSPFSPAAPVVLPRQGYVTIPRKPRAPSWSSAPTPTLLEDPLSPIKAEPVYDNLGPRTTADGSSILSLNKAGMDTPRARSSNAPNPNCTSTPNYPTFDDRESGILRPLPSPMSATNDRQFWGNRPGEMLGMKRVGSADGPIGPSPRPKVAPKPPPKPKRNGPLYEDDGEDGTEV